MINKKAFEALPDDLQAIVRYACRAVNQELLAENTARNPAALKTLLNQHKVDMRAYPNDVLEQLRTLSAQAVAELAKKDEFSQRVYDSYSRFREDAMAWSRISELAYLKARETS